MLVNDSHKILKCPSFTSKHERTFKEGRKCKGSNNTDLLLRMTFEYRWLTQPEVQVGCSVCSQDFFNSSNFVFLPFECNAFRWSTVSWRISAFSSFADPCFSNADGTNLFNSVSDEFILSLRFFSMTPRRFLRLINWQLSFSMDDGLI